MAFTAFITEQYLPCALPDIVSTIERKLLPSYEANLYHKAEMLTYPMHYGFYISSDQGSFYVSSLDLLETLNGKNAKDVCHTENDFREIEQYYHHGIIGFERNDFGRIVEMPVDRKFLDLYDNLETTWFCHIPLKLEIDITQKCNLTCIHCSRNASPNQPEDKISLQNLIDFLDRAGKLGVSTASFMGGEPTCHPEFIELAVIAKSAGIRDLSTSTNGLLIDEVLAEEMGALFGSIQVSIHGATSDTHDRIVRRPGAFVRACNTVKLLRRSNVHSLNISFTVMEDNFFEMPQMVRLAKELEVDFVRFLALFSEGRAKELHQWTQKEREGIGKTVISLRQDNLDFVRVEAGGFPPYYATPNDSAFYGCPAGRTLLAVNVDGQMGPCSNLDLTLGNIQENDVMDVWHSSTMRELRKRPTCNCSYSPVCSGGCLSNPNWEKMFSLKDGGWNSRSRAPKACG